MPSDPRALGDKKRAPNNRAVLPVLFWIGVAVYFLSFWLPAVRLGNSFPHPFLGWECALYALRVWEIQEASRLAFFGALINPMATLYVCLRVLKRAPKVQTFLAIAIVVFILPTWTSIYRMDMEVLVGHVAWIAGLGLLLIPGEQRWPQLSDLMWPGGAVILALAWLGYIRFSQEKIQPASQEDLFYFDVGVNFTSFPACERIHRYAEGHEDEEAGFQVRYLQSECFYFLAQAIFAPSFCDRVRSVSVRMKDGSKFTPRFCKKQFSASPGGFSPTGAERVMRANDPVVAPFAGKVPITTSSLVWTSDSSAAVRMQMMRAAGYTDDAVREFIRPRRSGQIIDTVYAPTSEDYSEYFYHLATDYKSPERADFLRRVLALP